MPGAEQRADHRDRGGPGQHPVQCRGQHRTERDLFPADRAHGNAQQHVVGELPPAQPGDPLVTQQPARGGGRGQRKRDGDRGPSRRAEPHPGSKPLPPQAKFVRP
jgi:hypothetical protein